MYVPNYLVVFLSIGLKVFPSCKRFCNCASIITKNNHYKDLSQNLCIFGTTPIVEGQLVVLQIEAICGSGGIPTFVCEQQFSLFHTFPFLFECLSKTNPNICARENVRYFTFFSFLFECWSKNTLFWSLLEKPRPIFTLSTQTIICIKNSIFIQDFYFIRKKALTCQNIQMLDAKNKVLRILADVIS